MHSSVCDWCTVQCLEALIEQQEKGVKVVLCSGRPTSGLVELARELFLDKFSGYLISYNGANIIDFKENKLMYENCMTVEQIHRLYDLSKDANIGIHTYSDTHIIAEQEYKYTKFESNLVGMNIQVVDNFKESVNKPVVKAIMVEESYVLKEVENRILKHTKDLTATYSKPFFLEFMSNCVDKGQALKWLCEKVQIKPSETIAFGDSHNDLAMLKFAGKSVAMGNAVNEVKEMADFIAKTNDEDGIYYALEQFISK